MKSIKRNKLVHVCTYIVLIYFCYQAVDYDEGANADVRYVLTGSAADLFVIDEFNGEIRVNTTLDREVTDVSWRIGFQWISVTCL